MGLLVGESVGLSAFVSAIMHTDLKNRARPMTVRVQGDMVAVAAPSTCDKNMGLTCTYAGAIRLGDTSERDAAGARGHASAWGTVRSLSAWVACSTFWKPYICKEGMSAQNIRLGNFQILESNSTRIHARYAIGGWQHTGVHKLHLRFVAEGQQLTHVDIGTQPR